LTQEFYSVLNLSNKMVCSGAAALISIKIRNNYHHPQKTTSGTTFIR